MRHPNRHNVPLSRETTEVSPYDLCKSTFGPWTDFWSMLKETEPSVAMMPLAIPGAELARDFLKSPGDHSAIAQQG